MGAGELISRLEGVRQTGRDRWIARCPAHDDKRASMSIRELGDGRVLVKCFALCETHDILAAVGLTFEALFPERAVEHGKPERRAFPALDVLRCCAFETMVAAVSARHVASGHSLTPGELDRLWQAASRLQHAAEVAGA